MPLDFNASGVTHTPPKGTLDFVSPEQTLFAFDATDGSYSFFPNGAITGQFLQAQWAGAKAYGGPGGTVSPTWGNGVYIGAGTIGPSQTAFGTATLVQEKFAYPVGDDFLGFGRPRLGFDDDYLTPTVKVNAKWANEPYTPSVGNRSAAWSSVVQLTPISIEPTLGFGSPTIIEDKRVEVSGWSSTQFGNGYVLRWFEYAPPWTPLNASWLGQNVYTAAVEVLNVAWVPPVEAQTVGPVSFVSSQFGSPRVSRSITVAGIAPTTAFGNTFVDLQGEFLAVDIYDGASAEVDVETDKTSLFFDSFYEGAGIDPVALDAIKLIDVEFFSGESITPSSGCNSPTGLQRLAGDENYTSPTGNSFRLQNPGSPTSGSNIAAAPINVASLDEIEFAWNQVTSGAWYDNDNSDASHLFGLFFDRTLTNITTLTSNWEYDSPFEGYTIPPNLPWVRLWLPNDTTAKTNFFEARNAAGKLTSNFNKPAGLDYYNGSRIRVRLTKEAGKARIHFYVNDVLQHSYLTVFDWPTTVVPLWHYRNYTHSGTYIDVSNVQVCTDELLTVESGAGGIPGVQFYADASAEVALSTDTTLSFNVYADATLSGALETYPPAQLAVNVYEGADATASLWTQHSLPIGQYDGAAASVDLALLPQPNLLIQAYDGAAGSIDLSLAIQLGAVAAYEGGRADLTLDSEPNWFLYDGSAVSLEIATETTLEINGFSGGSVSLALTTFPSEGMGVFAAYDGASLDQSFTVLPQVLLYPNTISAAVGFNYDVLGFMAVDLNNSACCPVIDTHERIELTAGPAPDERYDGDKTVFTVDLSTLQRFKMDFSEGTHFGAIDPTYMEMTFRDAAMGLVVDLDFADYDFNLCKGNFIPDGDNVTVELVSTDLNNCEATVLYDGAEMQMVLAAAPAPDVIHAAGEYTAIDIEFTPALRFEFYAGENFRWPLNDIELYFYADAYHSLVFDEVAYIAYEGATMTIPTLTTDYEVEFLEVGCLDNEFVPMNENGDADLEKFNPVPVELDFFTHSIKARCY